MDTLLSTIGSLAGQNLPLAYFIVYIGTIFFGNIGAFIALWIAFQGAFGSWGVIIILMLIGCAGLTGDTLWYMMGRSLRTTRLGSWLKHRTPHYEKIERHIEAKGRRWMLFGKFAYGANFPIIFSIGWTRLPFPLFFRRALLAAALWLPLILGISYGLYSTISPLAGVAELKHFEILFLVGLGGFILVQILFTQIMRRILDRNGDKE